MEFYIYFGDNGVFIDNAFIKSCRIVTSIFDICPKVQLLLSGFDITLFNEIVLGRELIFYIADEGDLPITLPMKVVYFNKIPAALPTAETLEVDLVHSYAFNNTLETKAYGSESTTISNIIQSILMENSDLYFNSVNIEESDDRGAVRYCLKESKLNFLERILKYGSYKQFPIYLYTDVHNNINLKSFYTLLNNEVSTELYSLQKDATNASSNETTQRVLMNNFRYTADTKNSHSSITNYFTVDNFTTPSVPVLTFKSPENYLPEVKNKTTPKVIYKNWNLTPSDALAISAKESVEETIKSYYAVVNLEGSLYLKSIVLGNKVKVSLHQKPNSEEAIFGDGEYIIYKLNYYFDEKGIRTKIYLTTAI